ncbi:MAG: MipA/OmpV family protein [Pseudomonadota bacterium]
MVWLLAPLSLVAQNVVNAGNSTGEDGAGLPLWEIGAGLAAANTPAYPGSSVNQTNVLPLPIVIYRGRILRAGDGSLVSGRLAENERLELDISLNGSFNADSDDVDVRSGMPDLGFLFEIGPELEWHITPEQSRYHWKLEMPLRAAFSVDDGSLEARGWVFSPELELEIADVWKQDSELSIGLSPAFAAEDLMDYIYAVPSEFATAERPEFDANAGYLGTRFGVNWAHRSERRFFVIGLRATFLSGAENAASPLVEEKRNLGVFAAIGWTLAESKRTVTPRRKTP